MKALFKVLVLVFSVLNFSCSEDFVSENDLYAKSNSSKKKGKVFENQITRHGITWSFEKKHQIGQFANGDYWIVGPVNIVNISNEYHNEGFTPSSVQDGAMINPGTDTSQGYDGTINSYNPTLNVSYPNGNPISSENPLLLDVNESLVSSVSWLYNSETDKETGAPRFNRGTGTPRPVLRTAAVLTCLSMAPPEGSFRPPYCGSDKSIKLGYNKNLIQRHLLENLDISNIQNIPNISEMERKFERVWLDHVHQYLGGYLHPSENMKEYGREVSKEIGDAALLLNSDFSTIPGNPSKDDLLYDYIQLGIDLAGIADNGGSWPSNGGWHMGRKWPILFAGLMLNDQHLMDVGNWSTAFQEDGQTFYVTQNEVDITNSAAWNPDSRISDPIPYSEAEIGLPEWGIRHDTQPTRDALNWNATYRHINGVSYGGFVLAAHIMGQKEVWNHPPLFDYMDRWWELTNGSTETETMTPFTQEMWQFFREDYPPVWSSLYVND